MRGGRWGLEGWIPTGGNAPDKHQHKTPILDLGRYYTNDLPAQTAASLVDESAVRSAAARVVVLVATRVDARAATSVD